MKLKIQEADKRHLPDINRLIMEARLMDHPMEKLDGYFWFIRIRNKIVACAGLDFYKKNGAVLTHLVVDREYRHRGIGSLLIAHRISEAKKRKMKIAALATMYYHFNFYKKRGFKTCPRAKLPKFIKNYWMFTAKRYKKCAVMYQEFE